MSKLMKEISNTEVYSLLNQFSGKKVLLDVRKDNCLYVFNYKQFSWEQDKEYIILKGADENEELRLIKNQIVEFSKLDSESIYHEVIEFKLLDGIIINLGILDIPIKCCKCEKVINDDLTTFSINGNGNYGSHFDGQKVNVKCCDDCLHTFLKKQCA